MGIPLSETTGVEAAPREVAPPASFQRAVSCSFIRASGGYAVKLARGSKAPPPKWEPRDGTEARSRQVLAEVETDETTNLGIHFHGNLIDVDVNGEDAHLFLAPALEALAPACAHVWGRPARPRTHRSYLIEGAAEFKPHDHPIIRRMQDIAEVKINVRGGPPARGEFSLLPGSAHPDGELYEWGDLAAAKGPPTVASVDDVLQAVRMAGAIAVLAPNWPKGGDQKPITGALAGFLHRAHNLGESIDAEFFRLTRDHACALVDVLSEVLGSSPEVTQERRVHFDATWGRADDGKPVTGATALAKALDDRSIIEKLYVLLTDSPEVRELDSFMERFVIWQGPGQAIDLEAVRAGSSRPFMSRPQLANSFGHRFVDVGGKRRLLPELMWSMRAVTRVQGLTFEPGKDEILHTREGTRVNQWSGFSVEPHKFPVDKAEIQRFLDYIYEVICSSNPTYYPWVLSWIADIFKAPGNKAGTALVLVGRSGAGKTFLGENIIGKIIGDRHYSQTTSIAHLTGHFNLLYGNQLLIQCDEATNSWQRSEAAKLKALITDAKQRIEPKGVDAYFAPLHARLLFTSNETEEALYLNQGRDDRRYTVLEVSGAKKGKIDEYWLPFLEWLESPDILAKIHRYLRDHRYSKASIKTPLGTLAKERMQQRSWDPTDAWMAEMLSRGHPLSDETHQHWSDAPRVMPDGDFSRMIDRTDWPVWVSPDALARDYRDFLKTQGTRTRPMSSGVMALYLRDRGLYPAELTTAADTVCRVQYLHEDRRRTGRVAGAPAL